MKRYITRNIAIHPAFEIRLAALDYNPGSGRPDDCGSLFVAPVVQVTSNYFIAGTLAIYSSTNGDPIFLGFIEGNEVTWEDEEEVVGLFQILRDACWLDEKVPESAVSLLELIRDSIPELD
jgi:hypothetical protein